MNANARVIIGAGYGDEGKGLATDYFTAPHGERALVIRFNGGAQAGHTVVTPDGLRHVFSHYGSGTLNGSKTYLSKFFIANPLVFFKERDRLYTLLSTDEHIPKPFLDRSAPITTPYDILINQILEISRGASRHGSCGIGIGETIERNLRPHFRLVAADLEDLDKTAKTLEAIARDWIPERLAKFTFVDATNSGVAALLETAADPRILRRFVSDLAAFKKQIIFSTEQDLKSVLETHEAVFEGAQGLMLDQDRGAFPFVTRSNTGLKNVLDIAKGAGIEKLHVTYMTRAYTTRHGAGPLAHEVDGRPYEGVYDTTNIANDYQGRIRFGFLDGDVLASAIAEDLSDARDSSVDVEPSLMITCLDHVGERVKIVLDGTLADLTPEDFIATLQTRLGTATTFLSYGPTRDTVRELTFA